MIVNSIKKLSKKSLSVLLAVVMIMTSMSVCFGTIASAAGGSISDYSSLAALLNKDTVKNATWSQTKTNDYVVNDPDGSVLAAIEAYFNAFNTLANKTPAVGSTSTTTKNSWSKGSTESNRTMNQVNTTIRNGVKAALPAADQAAVDAFLAQLCAGASVSTGTSSEVVTVNYSTSDNKNAPSKPSNFAAIPDAKITVMVNALADYTLDNLPESVVTSKVFTIKHGNDKYDSYYNTGDDGADCNPKTTYYRSYRFFYYISANVEAVNGAAMDTAALLSAKATLEGVADYFTKDINGLIDAGTENLATVRATVISTKNAVVAGFGADAWNHLFQGTYDVATLVNNIDDAASVLEVKPVTDNLTALVADDYDSIITDETALRNLYATLTAGLSAYDSARAVAKEYIANKGFDREAVQTFADNVLAEIYLIELRRLKADIDATIPTYQDYTEDMVINKPITEATLNLNKGTVDGYIQSINSYPAMLVNQVMRGYTDTLSDLSDKIAGLMVIAGYNDAFSAEYAKYVKEIYKATNPKSSSADLLAALKGNKDEGIMGYDEWYTGLKSLLDRIEANLEPGTAEDIMEGNDAKMKERMEAAYAQLHANVRAEIDLATELYAAIKSFNGTININNVSVYSRYKQLYKSLDRDSYEFLKSSSHFEMPQETIDKYNALVEDFALLESFLKTAGFSTFKTYETDYVDRPVLDNDLIKDEAYDVESETVEQILTSLDALISSDVVGGLLGGLLAGDAEEGEEAADFDIATTVKGLIGDMLFSDALINSIIQMLYPMILAELLKVWEKDLPTEINESAFKGTIKYNKTIDVISKDLGLPLYPSDVADLLTGDKYAENRAMLKTASKITVTHREYDESGDFTVVVDVTPWTEENPDLFNEDGTLKLTWGVDAAKEAGGTFEEVAEAFYQGFDDAVEGLKPLLNVLLANKSWTSNKSENVASVSGKALGFMSVNENAHLSISADACPGYANLIIPIFEALGGRADGTGLFSFASASTFSNYASAANSTADMLRAIFGPLFDFIDVLAAAPLSTLVGILPNLCYALSMQMVGSLLGGLGTSLNINVEIANSTLQACAGSLIKDLIPSMDFMIGDLIGDINELIDLSDGLNSILALAGLPIPALDQAAIAQMGSLDKFTSARIDTHYSKDGLGLASNQAFTITADKGAVMYYLLQYIFDIVADEEEFANLLGMFMTKDIPVLDAEGNSELDEEGNEVTEAVPDEEAIAETIAMIDELGLFKAMKDGEFTKNYDYAMAALVELFAPVEYDAVQPAWKTEATFTYLEYNTDWTEEKAEKLVGSVDAIVEAVLKSSDPEADFAGLIEGMLSGLFTTDTITGLVKAIASFGTMLGTDEMVHTLVGSLGADLTLIYNAFGYLFDEEAVAGENKTNITVDVVAGEEETTYVWYYNGEKFEDGDKDMFVDILTDVLSGLTPVLMKFLKGEEFKILDAIELKTYHGYGNSIGLLLEALGVDVISQAEFSALSDDKALAYILDTLLGKIDEIVESDKPIKAILELLPNLIYFIECNGISALLYNALMPIIALVDTVRPIFDVNLNFFLSYAVSSLVAFGTLEVGDNILSLLQGTMPEIDDPEGKFQWIAVDIANLSLKDILPIVDILLGTDLLNTDLGIYGLADFCYNAEAYNSVIDGGTAYRASIDAADALTILIASLFDSLDDATKEPGKTNLDLIFEMAEIDEETANLILVILNVIKGYNVEINDINWAYMYGGDMDKLAAEGFPEATFKYLDYTTDWTVEAAQGVYGALDTVADMFLPALLEEMGAENVADLVNGILEDNVYSTEVFGSLVEMIVNALGNFKFALEAIDIVLDVNTLAWFDMCELDEEGNYVFDAEEYAITDRASFISTLKKIIAPANGLLAWFFFGDDYTFFNGKDGNALITLNGGKGYAYGLAPILEALGLEMKVESDYLKADGKYDVAEAVGDILNAAFDLVDEMTTSESVIEIAFDLIPNILYFISADGLKTCVNNLIAPAEGLLGVEGVADMISGFLTEEGAEPVDASSVAALIGNFVELPVNISDLSLNTILGLLDLEFAQINGKNIVVTDEMENVIRNIYAIGEAESFTAATGKTAYRVAVEGYDVLTVLLSFAIEAFEANGDIFSDLLGAEQFAAIVELIKGAKVPFTYATPDWDYMGAELNETGDTFLPAYAPDSIVATYLQYNSDWNENTAQVVIDSVDTIVQSFFAENESLGKLTADAIANGLYQEDILRSLIPMVVELIYDYGAVIEEAGAIFGIGAITEWFNYCAIETDADGKLVSVTVTKDFGIDSAATAEAKAEAFVNAFVEVLAPAYEVLEWVFFANDITLFNAQDGSTLITITGGKGYEYGLVPLFEAISATMPGKAYENGESGIKSVEELRAEALAEGKEFMEVALYNVFSALTGWLSDICGDLAKADEYGVITAMLDRLPNFIYNLNAGTLDVIVNNLLLPIEEVLQHLGAFGVELDIKAMLADLGVTSLNWYGVFALVEDLVGLYWPKDVQEFLATLYIGKLVAFESANGETAYRVALTTEAPDGCLDTTAADVLTIVLSFVLDGILDKRNAPRLSGWLGADIYTVIYNYLSGNLETVDYVDIDWMYTDKVGQVLSPVTWAESQFGELYNDVYTKDMGNYIEFWLPRFVDTMIVLLGVNKNDGSGETYDGLEDMLNSIIGTSIYTVDNVYALLDTITGLIESLKAEIGEAAFYSIANVLKAVLDVDVTYWDNYTVDAFATGDRDAFVAELLEMLEPIYPIVSSLLIGEDLVSLFNVSTKEGEDTRAIVVEGAEGYAEGIIPLLEAFDYDSDLILTPADYKAAADGDAKTLLANIINPLLNVVDTVLADPVNEIFNVLPGLLYFVNSGGLDAAIKNTANVVFTVLANIEPIIGEIDIYDLIGLYDIEGIEKGEDGELVLDIDTILAALLADLETETGFDFKELAIDAVGELTMGEVVKFTSKNGETAYTMVYANGADRADMATIVLRAALTFVSIPENVVALEALLEGELSEEGYDFVCALLENFSEMAADEEGIYEIMYTVYQIFYAANNAAYNVDQWLEDFNGDYSFLNELFATSEVGFMQQIRVSLGSLLDKYTGDIIDGEELAPNGFIRFFQQIADFFQKIADWFKNLFS